MGTKKENTITQLHNKCCFFGGFAHGNESKAGEWRAEFTKLGKALAAGLEPKLFC
jgi:rRNA pseudouridine-1189 N-methylase Emg1 (Nep1/Mra1 family)